MGPYEVRIVAALAGFNSSQLRLMAIASTALGLPRASFNSSQLRLMGDGRQFVGEQ